MCVCGHVCHCVCVCTRVHTEISNCELSLSFNRWVSGIEFRLSSLAPEPTEPSCQSSDVNVRLFFLHSLYVIFSFGLASRGILLNLLISNLCYLYVCLSYLTSNNFSLWVLVITCRKSGYCVVIIFCPNPLFLLLSGTPVIRLRTGHLEFPHTVRNLKLVC